MSKPGASSPRASANQVLDVCDFFDEATKTGGDFGQQPSGQQQQGNLHNPVTMSGLNPHDNTRNSSWDGVQIPEEDRQVSGTYCPVPLRGVQELSPSSLHAYEPADEEKLLRQLRSQNGLQPSGQTPISNSMLASPDASFIRNQLWRMDQMYVENELRIQNIDSELSQARALLTKLCEQKRTGTKDKSKGDGSKKKKQKLDNNTSTIPSSANPPVA